MVNEMDTAMVTGQNFRASELQKLWPRLWPRRQQAKWPKMESLLCFSHFAVKLSHNGLIRVPLFPVYSSKCE